MSSKKSGVLTQGYQLVSYNRDDLELSRRRYDQLKDLACAMFNTAWSLRWASQDPNARLTVVVRQEVFSPRGKLLPADEVLALGRSIQWHRGGYLYFRYVFRQGPVHNIRKWRGGGSNKAVRTMSEYRATAFVDVEAGEVAARPCRRGNNIRQGWDRWPRCIERSWKYQHKGRKNWDRPAKHGANH